MNCYLDYEIALGKRQLVTPLDLDIFYSSGVSDKPKEKSEKRRDFNSALDLNDPKITLPPDGNELCESIQDGQMILSMGDLPVSTEGHPFVHTRLREIKDILMDVCLTENLDVKRYKTLDERQRSLMNKILSSVFESSFLDLIDTYHRRYINTTEFLRKDVKSRASLALHLRLHCLINKKITEFRISEGSNTSKYKRFRLTQQYFASFLSNMYHTDTTEHEDVKTQPSISHLIQSEVEALKTTAVSALTEDRTHDWLSSMQFLLREMVEVPFEKVSELYITKLDLKLSLFLHDEDKNVNGFFPKLKLKLKSGIVKPPATKHQLKLWDTAAIELLNQKIKRLEIYLNKQ